MMTILSLYLPILLSLSLSFLLHTFKKHVHSFFLLLVTTFQNNINTISNNSYQPISSSPIVTHAIDSPPSRIMFVDEEIGGGADKLKCCTESLGFESIDEMRVDDQIDKIEDHNDIDKDNNNKNNRDDVDEDEDEDEEGCCEVRRDWRELKKSFPPPLSSLNQKGQPSFALVPVRKNGTLQLNKVRIKRPEILYASREDGRLRLYLVPDHCNDVEEEEEEYEGEEEKEEQELVKEDIEEEAEEQEEEAIVESEEDEEIIRHEKEEDRVVGDWKFHNNIEGFRRCHQVVNQCHNHHHHHHHHHYHDHHHHHNLHMYGVSIA